MDAKETIAIWHDYDCDGIPAGALLFDFFRTIGYPVITYVPERSEGYGLNDAGLRTLKEQGAAVVITVDCGITDSAEAELAKELGMDLIITDHHLPQEKLPDAYAVINAHRKDDAYPFKDLCGTGVAFKLVEAIVSKKDFGLPKGFEKWLLDLVALATVADMVLLHEENRALVSYGLKVLRKGRRPGLKAIFDLERIPLRAVTEDDLAFSVAPKVNAASRMASPRLAFELLTTESAERATQIAKELTKLNKARKLEGMHIAKEVKKKIESMPSLSDVIVMGSESWRPSLLGIAATAVVETYGKPVCLWGKDGELIKGSCRSDGSVNIVHLMTGTKDVFEDFGGHELSGGFSLKEDAVFRFQEALEESLKGVSRLEFSKDDNVHECLLTLAELNESAYDALRSLAPFGQGNPKPVFRLVNVRAEKFFKFGAHKEHARVTLSDDSGASIDAISFFLPRTSFRETFELMSPGDRITVDGSLEQSHFLGRKELRFRIENLTFA
jgi:single-stranded-DNA-specific exonuclease